MSRTAARLSGRRPPFEALALAVLLALTPLASFAQKAAADGGIDVGRPSTFRHLLPAEALERQAGLQYQALLKQAAPSPLPWNGRGTPSL